jgi:hypothetical protein
MCMILSVTAPALAVDSINREVRAGSSTIDVNTYAVIGEFRTDRDQSIAPDISYSVFTIGDNGPVFSDILLMDESNYSKYQNHQAFTYILNGSKIGQSAQSVSVSNLVLAQNNHFFLVADNTNEPPNGSTPTQQLRIGYVLSGVNLSMTSPSGDVIGLILIAAALVAVVLVVVLVVLFLAMRRRKGAPQPMAAPVPMQPMIKPATLEGNCPVCGKPVSPDFTICPNCGNQLKPMPPPVPVQSVIKPATPEGSCPVCGKPVSPDFAVCPNCGNRLK